MRSAKDMILRHFGGHWKITDDEAITLLPLLRQSRKLRLHVGYASHGNFFITYSEMRGDLCTHTYSVISQLVLVVSC